MAQHDYVIDNGPGLAVRTDINAAIQALASVNSGTVEPTTPVAGMLWLDTATGTNGTLKQRNLANTGWVGATFTAVGTGTIDATGNVFTKGNMMASPGSVFTAADPNPGCQFNNAGFIQLKRAGTANQAHVLLYNNASVTPTLVALFSTSGTATILSNEAAGGIQLRPTSASSTTGQVIVNPSGNVQFSAGIFAPANSTIGATDANAATVADGVVLGSTGIIYSKKNGTANQNHIYMINNCAVTPATVGTISTSGSTTSYNPSSDERLKTFTGNVDPDQAIQVIRADPAREYTWNIDGSLGIGWGAQTSYEILPYLANPPMFEERDEVGPTAQPGEPGFMPWTMDPTRRIPFLWAALAKALDRIDDLESRLAALEASP